MDTDKTGNSIEDMDDYEIAHELNSFTKSLSPEIELDFLDKVTGADPDRERPDAGVFSELKSGIKSGGANMASMISGVSGMVADTGILGDKLQAQAPAMMREAGRYQELGSEMGPEVNELKKIEGVGDFFNYASGLLGQFLPDVGMMAVSGLSSAAAKKAGKGMVDELIEKEIALQMKRGISREVAAEATEAALRSSLQNPKTLKSLGRLGNWAAKGGLERTAEKAAFGATQAAYSVARESSNNATDIFNETGQIDSATALKYGVPAGLMDAVGDTIFGGKVFGIGKKAGKEVVEETAKRGFRGFVGDVAKAGVKGGLFEAPTEAFQEGLGIASVKDATGQSINPLDWEPEDYSRMLEGAAAGAILGGALGGLGGVRESIGKSVEASDRYKGLSKSPKRQAAEQSTREGVDNVGAAIDNAGRAAEGLEQLGEQGIPTDASQAALEAIAKKKIGQTEAEIEAAAQESIQGELSEIVGGEPTAEQELDLKGEQSSAQPDAKQATNEKKAAQTPDANPTPSLPANLAKSGKRYNYGEKEFQLEFESDLDRAAYYTAQENPSSANDQFLTFGEQNGYTPAEFIVHGKQVKAAIKTQAKVSNPGTLSIPKMADPKTQTSEQAETQTAPEQAETQTAPEQELEIPTPNEATENAEALGDIIQAEDVTPLEPRPPSANDNRDVVSVPVENLQLSKDVPNFKKGANPITGEVNPLKGEFLRKPTKPILLWQRTNGNLEVISGRHRWQHANRTGEKTIAANIWKESDGYTAQDMMTLDAEDNIRENQGTITDYATYARNTEPGLTSEQARKRFEEAGLLRGAKAISGFEIGRHAGDALFAAFYNESVPGLTERKAALIATAAPLDDNLQRATLKVVANLTEDAIPGFIAGLRNNMSPTDIQMDMFGDNDSYLNDTVTIAKEAVAKQRAIQGKINVVERAANNPETAAELGVDVSDPEATKLQIVELEAEKARYKNFWNDSDVMAELLGRPVEKPRSVEIAPVEARTIDTNGEGNLFSEQETPFNLNGEEDITPLLAAAAAEEAAIAEAQRIADENQMTMFDAPAEPEASPAQEAAQEVEVEQDPVAGTYAYTTVTKKDDGTYEFRNSGIGYGVRSNDPVIVFDAAGNLVGKGTVDYRKSSIAMEDGSKISMGKSTTAEDGTYTSFDRSKDKVPYTLIRDTPKAAPKEATTESAQESVEPAVDPNATTESKIKALDEAYGESMGWSKELNMIRAGKLSVEELTHIANSPNYERSTMVSEAPNLTPELKKQVIETARKHSGDAVANRYAEELNGKARLESRTPATIRKTPTTGEGAVHGSKIRAAIETAARMFPGRKMRFAERLGGDYKYSQTPDSTVEAYYDPNTDEMVFVTDNISDEVRAAQLFFHEATEGNLSRMDSTPEGKKDLDSVFERSKLALAKETPALLTEAGYGSLQELADAYGADMKTEEGRRAVQWEVVARFAEKISADPKPPGWWKQMLADLKNWFKKHFNIAMTATDLEGFLRKAMSETGSIGDLQSPRILMSKSQRAEAMTVDKVRGMNISELTQVAEDFKARADANESAQPFLDIVQDEILRRAIKADRVVGGSVTIDRDWAFRAATNPDGGGLDFDAFEAALAERVLASKAVYVQGGKSAEITAIVGGHIILDEGDAIPLNRFALTGDKIFAGVATAPDYLNPGERRGKQNSNNVGSTTETFVDEPTPDLKDKATYYLHKAMKPVIGDKDGNYKFGGLIGSGDLPAGVRDLINSKNAFIAAKAKIVEFRWKAYSDAIKKAFPDGVPTKLLNTAFGVIANNLSPAQVTQSEVLGYGQYTLTQARWVRDNRPALLQDYGQLDTQAKRNSFLRSKLNAAEYNQMNSRATTAKTEATNNALGALRLNNYNKQKAAKAAALEQLPQEVSDAITDMQLSIDELMADGVNRGVLTSRMSAAVGDQPGLYMVRTYQVLDDTKFRAKVKQGKALKEETTRLADWIHTQLINQQARKVLVAHNKEMETNPDLQPMTVTESRLAASVSEEAGRNKVLPYLRKLQDARYEDQAYTVLDEVMGGQSKQLGIPQELMDAWGIYIDPGKNFAKTMQRVSQDMATTHMTKEIIQIGTEAGWLIDPANGGIVPDSYVKMNPIGDYNALSELKGLYVDPKFKKFFEQYYDPADVNVIFKSLAYGSMYTSLAKTVMSVPSLAVNFMSNAAFSFVAGDSFDAINGGVLRATATSWAGLRAKGEAAVVAEVEKMVKLGVFGNNVGPQMIKEIMHRANNDIDSIETDLNNSLLNPDSKWYKSATGVVKKTVDFRGRLYGMADEVWKVNGFYARVKNIQEHQNFRQENDPDFTPMTQEQIELEAATYVRDVYPTYDLAPQFVKDMRLVPVLGQFMTFTAAMLRSAAMATKYAVADIKSGDKFRQNRGYLALGRMATTLALPTALSAASMVALGISSEEEEAFRESLPDYYKNDTFIFTGKDENGVLRAWNTSRIDPFQYMKEPFFAALRELDGKPGNINDAALTGLWTAIKPWAGLDINTTNALEVFYNTKGNGGRIYNPEDSGWGITGDALLHFAKGFEPGDSTMVRKLYSGAFGEADLADEVKSAFGFRITVNDPVETLGFAGWKANKRLRDANSILTSSLYDNDNIEGAFTKANNARTEIIKSVWKQYQAGITRGASQEALDEQLKGRGFSKDLIKQIQSGYVTPYSPGRKTRKAIEGEALDELDSLLKSTERVYFK